MALVFGQFYAQPLANRANKVININTAMKAFLLEDPEQGCRHPYTGHSRGVASKRERDIDIELTFVCDAKERGQQWIRSELTIGM